MKKIVFLIIILMAGYQNGYTQINLPYKPFNKFENDTTIFLDYNFNQRANQYKGLKISDVLKDLQFTPTGQVITFKAGSQKTYPILIEVYINEGGFRRYGQYITIYWKEDPKNDDIIVLLRKYGFEEWTEYHNDFFKDMIVEKVVYFTRR